MRDQKREFCKIVRLLNDYLKSTICGWLFGSCIPGKMYIFLERLKMSNKFLVHILMPALDPSEVGEVVARKLVRKINDGDLVNHEFPASQTEVTFEATQDDVVLLSLYNKDDAGNYSTSSSDMSFVVLDTIPPGAPGAMSVNLEEIP